MKKLIRKFVNEKFLNKLGYEICKLGNEHGKVMKGLNYFKPNLKKILLQSDL